MKAPANYQSTRMKEQFTKHHNEHKSTSQHPQPKGYPKFTVKPPDFVEFGRAFSLPTAMITDDSAARVVYDTALSDFFKAKAENFPTWTGLPEIKIGPSTDILKRDVQVAWYAQVPREHLINPDDKLEEDLWNS